MVQVSTQVVGVSEVAEQFRALAKKLPFEVLDTMRQGAAILERRIKLNITGGNPLKTVSGILRASYSSRVFTVAEGVRGVVGSPVRYAAIHETGGEIRPTRAKALTIPIAEEAKRRSARDFPNLFIWKRPGDEGEGSAYLAQPTGDGGFKLMYQLRSRVFIPARRYVSKAQEVAGPKIVALIGNKVAELTKKHGGK